MQISLRESYGALGQNSPGSIGLQIGSLMMKAYVKVKARRFLSKKREELVAVMWKHFNELSR